tara:strand:+ start:2382 stop:2687 length:306 start_codon:yes stop_codon:yes gene_type:complete
VSLLEKQSESFIGNLNEEIDYINQRLIAIQKLYKNIIDVKLKHRLRHEYESLNIKFEKMKDIILLTVKNSKCELSISKLLLEKYFRYYNDISKNNSLFLAQ